MEKPEKCDFVALEVMKGHNEFESYHLMIDNETDDVSCWEEYKKPDGSNYHLGYGDFIVKIKS